MNLLSRSCFFFNDTATTEIYTLSLHDALPIFAGVENLIECNVEFFQEPLHFGEFVRRSLMQFDDAELARATFQRGRAAARHEDRKSTRLNSSHSQISYAVFCLKKKTKNYINSVNFIFSNPAVFLNSSLYFFHP